MKKLILIVVALSITLLSCTKEEQECPCDNPLPEKVYNGSLWVTSIEDLEEFRDEKYTIVTGYIYVRNNDYVTDLKYFENLTEVHGDFRIESIPITSLEGLNNLRMISGELSLCNLDIEDLTPLENVEYFGYDVSIRYMPLKDLKGLQNIKKLQSLTIEYSDLESLYGLGSLEEISNTLKISHCDELTSLKGLDKLISIRAIDINSNEVLSSFGCFNNITSFSGIRLSYNPLLSDISDLKNVELIYGDCYLSNLPLRNLNALSGLSTIGGDFTISENPNLSFIMENSNLQKVENSLSIRTNENLTNLYGLESITNVGGFDVSGNKNLLTLDGINPNIYHSDYISIGGNEMLSDFCAISDFVVQQGNDYPYSAGNNKYNPTYQDFVDGECSDK